MILKWLKNSLSGIFKNKKRKKAKRRKRRSLKRRSKKARVTPKKKSGKKLRPSPSKRKSRVISHPAKTAQPSVRIIKPPPTLVRQYPRSSLPRNAPPAVQGVLVGKVTHYFNKIQVAVLQVERNFKTGETIEVRRGSNLIGKEAVRSMQINHIPIDEAKRGEEIGMKLIARAEIGDEVYRL